MGASSCRGSYMVPNLHVFITWFYKTDNRGIFQEERELQTAEKRRKACQIR